MFCEKSTIDEETRVIRSICMQTTPDRRTSIATILEIPFFCIQNSGGAQIIDKNTANKKGTTITIEAFIPATIIINAAN